ncbi:MAG: hypothetical protein AVDCRST_MAG66-2637, partial [uncultured Pseudonocardia sp.]
EDVAGRRRPPRGRRAVAAARAGRGRTGPHPAVAGDPRSRCGSGGDEVGHRVRV